MAGTFVTDGLTSEERVDLKCDNAWGHKMNGDGWMYGKYLTQSYYC